MIEATIRQTKRMLKECVEIYLEKDEEGRYCLPQNKQRPVYLEGPSGIGKTELVKQVAQEAGIGFVSYSMTHHNRQSAVGLPAIVDKELGGEAYKATQYTMSEIVEAVWEAKRRGSDEGILFTDEVNCVSETLTAAMLQFLQNKTFGPHQIPEGWVIMAAGNPPEHNRSVKAFDVATLDRLRVIHMKPDRDDWLAYAAERGMHPLVIQYVREHPQEFYCCQNQKGTMQIATARGWEDLSNILKAHERKGFAVDEAMVGGFIQNETIAVSFLNYYRTVKKLVPVEELRAILNGTVSKKTVDKISEYDFPKRWAVVVNLYSMLQGDVESILSKLRAHDKRSSLLKEEHTLQQEKESFWRDTETLDQGIRKVQRSVENTFHFLGEMIGDDKESGILVGMILDNQYFQELSGYCRLDSLIDAYEKMQNRMATAKRDIKAWIRGEK